MCVGVTSRGRTLQNLFLVCVGGPSLPTAPRLGSETPDIAGRGFGGTAEVWEWSPNTYALTQQLEAFKSLTGVPLPPYFGLVSSTSQRVEYCLLENLVVRIGDPRKGSC